MGIISTCERRLSYLRINEVLFSVRMLTSNRTWVSPFIISSKQSAVFLIGNPRIDGRIWKVAKNVRVNVAEPGGRSNYAVWSHFSYDMSYYIRWIYEWFGDFSTARMMHHTYVILSEWSKQQAEIKYGASIEKSGCRFLYPDLEFCDESWNSKPDFKAYLFSRWISFISHWTLDITNFLLLHFFERWIQSLNLIWHLFFTLKLTCQSFYPILWLCKQ